MRIQKDSLAQAMALLIQNQAAFIAQLGANQKTFGQLEARMARVERSLEEVERSLEDIKATLRAQAEILAQLPERLKIGFKPRS
jgi:septal ring factor EnvC (AmiA/AmiB activator)